MQTQYLILTAILGWGVGSIFYKVANDNMHPVMVSACATAIFLILLPLAFIFLKFDTKVTTNGILAAIVGGICMCIGSMGYFYALRTGHAGVTTVLTSLYPALTLLISMIIFKESLTFKQGLGMVFAVISFILLALK